MLQNSLCYWRHLNTFFARVLVASVAVGMLALGPSVKAAEQSYPIQQLNQLLDRFQGLQAHFNQYNIDGVGQQTNSLQGNMSLVKPNRFFWQTFDPYPQIIVSNGDTLWLYDPDLEQVTRQKVDNDQLQAPALLLSGDSQNIVKSFNVSVTKRNDGSVKFALVPRAKDSLYSQIGLVFMDEQLQQMSLIDAQDQAVYFSFQDMVLNPIIDNAVFEFAIPPNTDIIDSN